MTLMIIIVAIIIAVVAFFILKTGKSMAIKTDALSENDSGASSRVDKSNPEFEFKNIMDTLLKLNILIRTDPRLDSEILVNIEAIIDDLKATIPLMMEKYPGETLTYELKKIGSVHLFKNVKEFLDLSDESRNNQMSIFKNTLSSLIEVSARARDISEKNETQEFKIMATFLKTKFQNDIV